MPSFHLCYDRPNGKRTPTHISSHLRLTTFGWTTTKQTRIFGPYVRLPGLANLNLTHLYRLLDCKTVSFYYYVTDLIVLIYFSESHQMTEIVFELIPFSFKLFRARPNNSIFHRAKRPINSKYSRYATQKCINVLPMFLCQFSMFSCFLF